MRASVHSPRRSRNLPILLINGFSSLIFHRFSLAVHLHAHIAKSLSQPVGSPHHTCFFWCSNKLEQEHEAGKYAIILQNKRSRLAFTTIVFLSPQRSPHSSEGAGRAPRAPDRPEITGSFAWR